MAEPATIHLHYTHPHATGQGTTPPRMTRVEAGGVREVGWVQRRREGASDCQTVMLLFPVRAPLQLIHVALV